MPTELRRRSRLQRRELGRFAESFEILFIVLALLPLYGFGDHGLRVLIWLLTLFLYAERPHCIIIVIGGIDSARGT